MVHAAVLQYCVESGLLFDKLHHAVRFERGDWLRRWVVVNSELRRLAQAGGDKFEDSLRQLMVYSVYGKCIEEARYRLNVCLCEKEAAFLNNSSRLAIR